MINLRELVKRIAALFAIALIAEMPLCLAANDLPGVTEYLSETTAKFISESIPRKYEGSKNWGRTTKVTTGLRSSGNFFDFDIRRRNRRVEHGVWQRYRVTLVDPEENLKIRIENLRTTGAGRAEFTLFISTKLQTWARAKVYDHGVHLIALEAEGVALVRLWIDAKISLETVPSTSLIPGFAVRLLVTDARLKLDDFRLKRVSDLKGPLARELGDGVRGLIEDQFSSTKLVNSLNRTIEKRRDRLQVTPDALFSNFSSSSNEAHGGEVMKPQYLLYEAASNLEKL